MTLSRRVSPLPGRVQRRWSRREGTLVAVRREDDSEPSTFLDRCKFPSTVGMAHAKVWFGDGCRRRDLLAHELSSTGLGASVPHAILGQAMRQGCSGTPLGTGRVFSAYGRPPGTAAGCGVHRFSCSPWSSSSSRFHRCLACLVVVQCHARLGSQRSATYSAGSSRRDRGC